MTYYSLDTLRLAIPVQPGWIDSVRSFFSSTNDWHWCRYNPTTHEVKVFNLTTRIRPESWHKWLYLSFREQANLGQSIILEFSLPKAIYGNNVGLMPWWKSDLTRVIGAVERYMVDSIDPDSEKMGPIFSDSNDWGILRLDVAWAWRFENVFQAQAMLNCLKNFRFKWRRSVIYQTGILYPNKQSGCKFYLKGPEFEKHDLRSLSEDESVDQDALTRVKEQADGLLRFEVTLRGKGLKNLGIEKLIDLDSVNLSSVLMHYLSRCTGMEGIYLTESEIYEKLTPLFTRAKTARLLDFCRILSTEGENFAMDRYGPDAFYRLKKDLRSALGDEGLYAAIDGLDGKDSFSFDTQLFPEELRPIQLFRYEPF